MVRTSGILLLLLLFAFQANSQRKWKDEFYQTLTNDNFRDFKLFKKELDPKKVDYKLINAAVFFVSNEARLEKGLVAAAYQPNLEIMAWNHSIAMAKRDFFDHYNPKDKKRKDPNQRARRRLWALRIS